MAAKGTRIDFMFLAPPYLATGSATDHFPHKLPLYNSVTYWYSVMMRTDYYQLMKYQMLYGNWFVNLKTIQHLKLSLNILIRFLTHGFYNNRMITLSKI